MRSNITRRIVLQRAVFIALAALFGFMFVVTPGVANELDDARNAGVIGERPDGLIGAVSSSVPANILSLIESVNNARLESYRALAEKEGTRVEAVQAVAGQRQIEKAVQNGWYVMDADGSWRKR